MARTRAVTLGVFALLSFLLASGCGLSPAQSDALTPTPAALQSKRVQLSEMQDRVPGFSGLYKDGDVLAVYVFREGRPDKAALEARVRQAIAEVYGPAMIPSGGIALYLNEFPLEHVKAWDQSLYADLNDQLRSVATIAAAHVSPATLVIAAAPDRGAREAISDFLLRHGIPEKAVDLRIGCDDVLTRFVLPRMSAFPELAGLEFTVEAPSEARQADTIPLRLVVRNTSDRPVEFRLVGIPRGGDFAVTDLEERKIWNWKCGRFFPEMLYGPTLSPGETFEFVRPWTLVNNRGDPVGAPGEYRIYGVLDWYPVMSEPVILTVLP